MRWPRGSRRIRPSSGNPRDVCGPLLTQHATGARLLARCTAVRRSESQVQSLTQADQRETLCRLRSQQKFWGIPKSLGDRLMAGPQTLNLLI